jgi:hypothetical protein
MRSVLSGSLCSGSHLPARALSLPVHPRGHETNIYVFVLWQLKSQYMVLVSRTRAPCIEFFKPLALNLQNTVHMCGTCALCFEVFKFLTPRYMVHASGTHAPCIKVFKASLLNFDTWCMRPGRAHCVSRSLKPQYSTSIHSVCIWDVCTVY